MTIKSKKFKKGIKLDPTTSPATEEGEIRNDSADNKLKTYTEGAERAVVTEDQTQTLSNKTIDSANNTITVDADEATVQNLEVDNLKAGVLETDLNNAVDDTKLPSAQSVKNYVAQEVATKDEASEISYDNVASGLTATNVQTAVDEVEGRLDTAESNITTNATNLSDHLADAVDAHDASAISNVPSGNLAATDVQSALNELQSDVDTRALDADLTAHINDAVDAHDASAVSYNNVTSGLTATDAQAAIDEVEGRLDTVEGAASGAQTSIDNHIADVDDAHDASAISNVPSGNLAATNVQAALDELQSDVDTRATDADLTAHTGATSGVHGVTGNVVGTTDAQTLTNKTLDGASIESPTRLDVKQDTLANLTTYATTATNGQLCFATDTKEMFQVIDAELKPVGGGGATTIDIAQASHGFAVGDGIYHNGTNWAKAQANDGDTLATYCVIQVPDANSFIAANFGRIEATAHGFTVGQYYFLSNSVAGTPTNVEPDTGFSCPLFYVEDANTLQIFVYRPSAVAGGLSTGSSSLDIFHTEDFRSTNAADATTGKDATFLNGGTIAGTVADEEVNQIAGTRSIKYTQAVGSATDYFAFGSVTLDNKQKGATVGVTLYKSYTGNNNEIDFVVYDVTNSAVISSAPLRASASSEKFEHVFIIPETCNSIRYGFQTATENSGAVLVVDDIQFKTDPLTPTDIYASSEPNAFTPPLYNGLGGATANLTKERKGKSLHIYGSFTTGTVTASEARIYLPSGLTVQNDNDSDDFNVGWYLGDQTSVNKGGVVLANNGDNYIKFGTQGTLNSTSTNPISPVLGTDFSSTARYTIDFTVPIAQYSNTSQGVVVKGQSPEEIEYYATDGFVTNFWNSTASGENNFDTTITPLTNSKLIEYNDTTETRIVAKQDVKIDVTVIGNIDAGQNLDVRNSSGNVEARVFAFTNDLEETVTHSTVLSAGDYIYFEKGSGTDRDGGIKIAATPKALTQTVTVPVDSLTGVSVRGEGNDGVTVISTSATDIPFTEAVDSSGAWDGDSYTVQKNNSTVKISGSVIFGSSATRTPQLFKNGSFYRGIGDTVASDLHSFSFKSTRGEFLAGDVLSIRTGNNGGTVSNNTAYHYLNITEEYGDRGLFLGNLPTNYIEEKFLAANVTTTGDIAELQFDGLEVGAWYEVSGLLSSNSLNGATTSINFRSASGGSGVLYGQNFLSVNSSNATVAGIGISVKFRAVSTTMYTRVGIGSGSTIFGDGSVTGTFVQLTKLGNTRAK